MKRNNGSLNEQTFRQQTWQVQEKRMGMAYIGLRKLKCLGKLLIQRQSSRHWCTKTFQKTGNVAGRKGTYWDTAIQMQVTYLTLASILLLVFDSGCPAGLPSASPCHPSSLDLLPHYQLIYYSNGKLLTCHCAWMGTIWHHLPAHSFSRVRGETGRQGFENELRYI